ncbi:unnamed protein product [marine sediment metagenome]|uniref:Uncharacterized protein n=1 Tax=marine sediment metagenome TaxID=412755 RepID=X1E1L2_9ZZZZ
MSYFSLINSTNMTEVHDHLNLAQLLESVKELDPEREIQVYHDPQTQLFYINYTDIIPFWIPRGAISVGRCSPNEVVTELSNLISYALKKLTDEPYS